MNKSKDFAKEMGHNGHPRKVSFNKEQSIENALSEASPDLKEYFKCITLEKKQLTEKLAELEEKLQEKENQEELNTWYFKSEKD